MMLKSFHSGFSFMEAIRINLAGIYLFIFFRLGKKKEEKEDHVRVLRWARHCLLSWQHHICCDSLSLFTGPGRLACLLAAALPANRSGAGLFLSCLTAEYDAKRSSFHRRDECKNTSLPLPALKRWMGELVWASLCRSELWECDSHFW